jgi:hypothetical protein
LLLTRLDPNSQRLWINVAHQLVEAYHRKSEVSRHFSFYVTLPPMQTFWYRETMPMAFNLMKSVCRLSPWLR